LNLFAADPRHHAYGGKPRFIGGVSTATTTLALPEAPRPRLAGFGAQEKEPVGALKINCNHAENLSLWRHISS
jgi:hypothetical protein